MVVDPHRIINPMEARSQVHSRDYHSLWRISNPQPPEGHSGGLWGIHGFQPTPEYFLVSEHCLAVDFQTTFLTSEGPQLEILQKAVPACRGSSSPLENIYVSARGGLLLLWRSTVRYSLEGCSSL